MRLAAVVAVAVAVAAAPLAACTKAGPKGPAVGTLTVPLARRDVGERWILTDDYSIEVEARRGAESAWFGSKRRHRTRIEVLEVDPAGTVTKVAATYLEREDQDSGPEGSPPAKRSVLAGKSYVVALVGGKLTATRADGGAVADAELRELTRDHHDLGKPPAMEEIMARTWTMGEKVDLTADELRRLVDIARPEEPRPTFMSITLREVRGDEAELAIRTRMQSSGTTSMTIDANGRVVIDARTGWPKHLSLSGAVNGTANGYPISGNLSARTEVTPD